MSQNLQCYSRFFILFLALIAFSSFNGFSQIQLSIGSPVDGIEGASDVSFVISIDNGGTNTTGTPITGSISYTGSATAGVDYVEVTSFSIADGASSSTITVLVIDDIDIECDETVVATISNPNVGTINSAAGTSTAIIIDDECPTSVTEPIDILDVTIYPNPMNSDLNFESEYQMKSYSILDLKGRVISNGNINSTEFSLNTSFMSSGSYIINVLFEDGKISIKNVLKN